MDGWIQNDYHIKEALQERGIDKYGMDEWCRPTSETTHRGQLDIFSVVNETIWKKSIDYHFPVCECDSIIFAHTQNYTTAVKVIEYLKKVLFPLQPKIQIYDKDSWKPLNDSHSESLRFKNGTQEVSSRLAFLLVTSEFCADRWGWAYFAGEPFFQRAMYDTEVTIVPILVNNPRKAKFKIPMGIRSLRSIEFYIKDDIICHDTVKHVLKPEIQKRLKKEKRELKNRVYWLYLNIISLLPPRGSAKHDLITRNNSTFNQEMSDSVFISNGYYENQPNPKYHRSISQGRAPDSAYASQENSDYCTGTSPSNCYTPRHHTEQLPTRGIKENIPHQTISQGRNFEKDNGSVLNGSNSPSIDMVEAPDLNFHSMEYLPSEPQKQLYREITRSERSQKDLSLNKTLNGSLSNGTHPDVVHVHSTQADISNASDNNIKNATPRRATIQLKEPNSAETNVSTNKAQLISNHHVSGNLPVAKEVECRSFQSMSLQSSNSMLHNKSSVHESESSNYNLSSSSYHHSSGMRSAQTSNENHLREALPNPRLISAQSLPGDLSLSLNSSHFSRSVGEENVHPLPREIKMDNFPSGDLEHSVNSYRSTSPADSYEASSSVTSSYTSSLGKTSPNIPPVPQKISARPFPTEEDLKSVSQSVPNVTQLSFGCLRPSDDFRNFYPSFPVSEPQSGRPVGVVKPLAMLDDDDDDEENDFTNDLSMPVANSEETYVKHS